MTEARYPAFAKVLTLTCGIIFALQLGAGNLRAQISEGSIVGLVTDPSDAPVANASVSATNVGTGVVSKTNATDAGWYIFPLLNAGSYSVSVEQNGFQRAVTSAVVLHAGDKLRIDVKLVLGQTTQSVQVTAAAPLVNATTTDLGTVIQSREVSELPFNGRTFTQILTLEPGWNKNNNAANRGGVSLNGMSGLGNNWLLDGVDMSFGENNGVGAGGIGFNGYLITFVSMDAIQELRATSGAAAAEYDRAAGGTVNITTKSGSDQFHGSAWEYLRNNDLNASTFFANKNHLAKPSLVQNEFGGNVGGPILKNKLFFFGNYEGVRSRQGLTLSGSVPTGAFYNQLTSSQMLTYMQKWYPQGGPGFAATSDPLTAIYTRNANESLTEDTYLGRVDGDFGKHRLTFRAVVDNQSSVIPNLLAGLASGYPYPTRNYEGSWTFLMTPSMVNEVKFATNSDPLRRHTYALNTALDQNLPGVGLFTIDPAFPAISMRAGPYNQIQPQDNLAADAPTKTIADDFTWVHGSHTVKAGINFRYTHADRTQYGEGVWYNFNTQQQLINDQVYSFELDFGNNGTSPMKYWTYGVYGQDNWKVNRRLSINYGLHYDFFQPLAGPIGFATTNPFGATTPLGSPLWNDQDADFSPRIGIVYNVTADGKTVVRAGGGTYYGAAEPFYYFNGNFLSATVPAFPTVLPASLPPNLNYTFPNLDWNFLQSVRSSPSSFPNLSAGITAPDPVNHHDEYSEQYNLTVEHQFTPSVVGSVSYVFNRELHMFSSFFDNLVNPATGVRPFASIGPVITEQQTGRLWNNALELKVRKTTSHGLAFDAFYTWSKSMSYQGVENNTNAVDSYTQDESNIAGSIGPTPGEIRNRFSADYVWAIPTGRLTSNSGLARAILAGWSWSGIIGANTGGAQNITLGQAAVNNGDVTPQRPDSVPGVSPYSHTANRLQFYNVAAFNGATPIAQQRFGNLGFDTVWGPAGYTYDTRIQKSWKVHEGQQLSFLFEMFNALNHEVFTAPSSLTLTSGSFGLITAGSNPRQMQLALRYSF